MNTNTKNKILRINKNHFNQNYIFFDLINNKDNYQFLNVIYRSPTIYLDGLCFETPWMLVKKNKIKNIYDSSKFFIELMFQKQNEDKEIKNFLQILSNIDKSTINFFQRKNNYFVNNKNILETYCKNIKYLKKDIFEENNMDNLTLKIKVNSNNKIIYNNKICNLNDIDLNNCLIKCDIITYGLWKYNNRIGYSWKGFNLKIIDNNMIELNTLKKPRTKLKILNIDNHNE